MRKLKFTIDRKSLQTIYFTFIRPILEYADVVWDNCSQYEANELEKIQNEAARIVTGSTKLVSISSLLSETGWETLSARRKKHKLLLFFKMQNSISPDYLASLVPPSVGSTMTYQLRNNTSLQTVHANSQLYYQSFLPSVIRQWNDLSDDTRNLPSIESFKHKLNEDVYKQPSFYFVGKRIGQIYHSRLRTGCSCLRQHLFVKNILPSPICNCGAVEDTYHFMLVCDIFSDLRQELFRIVSSFCPPTLDTLLYGNASLSDTNNKCIFLAVQDFIIHSKRFQT